MDESALAEKRGSKTRKTAEIALKAAAAGQTPLEYMLDILRSEVPPELKARLEEESLSVEMIQALSSWHTQRFEAAKAAAPYVHPRLQSTTVSIPDGLDVRIIERVIVRE